MSRPDPRLLPLLAAALSLSLLAACGAGGGAAGGDTDGGVALNQGSYTLADFDYVDQRPPGAHPLGRDGFQVLAREELFVVHQAADGEGRGFALRDDQAAGHATVADVADLFPGPDAVHAAAGGQLDDDADSELVVATIDPGESTLTLHLVERDLLGDYARTEIRAVASPGWNLEDARLTLADFDGDRRDEVVVVARSAPFHVSGTAARMWVFDDPQDGAVELFQFTRSGAHEALWALPVDIDDDGTPELGVGLSGDTTDASRYPVRLYDFDTSTSTMHQLHGWHYLNTDTSLHSSRAVVGDFDGNGRDDLAWVGYRSGSNTTMRVELFECVGGTTWSSYASWSIIDVSPMPTFRSGSWAVASFRGDARRDGVAIAFPDASDYRYTALRYERGTNQWSHDSCSIDRYASRQGIALSASDVDADGHDEVVVGLVHHGASGGALDLGVIEHAAPAQLTWQDSIALAAEPVQSSLPPVPVLAAADYDADGFAVRHTGMRSTRLADPIPLVVLAAPPTKSGISQNYDDTESAYSTASTQGSTIGVSTYSSVTAGVGVSFDLFGLIGVEGRASIERGIERTQETTKQETIVDGYRGAHDDDVIVFQGTLYETYEYVITAAQDPDAVGSFITIDMPVDANTYKWTVDYYNSQVAPEDRIGTDVLTHTAGEVETYPTRAQLADLLHGEVHWDLAGSRPVGQGNASDFQSVSFATESATSVQRTVEKSYGGGASFGVSGSLDSTTADGATHGVVYGEETTFEATVGDIADPDEYEAWRYSWGFSIHTVGRTSTDANEPTGFTGRKHSFQYLRYWAEPNGSAY